MRNFYVDNEEVWVLENWNISDSINNRSTLSVAIFDLKNLSEIRVGQEISVYDDNVLIFSGSIDEVEEEETDPNNLYYYCRCVDHNQKADKRQIIDVVLSKNAGDIVREHILPVLAEEGITEGTIQDGVLITKAVFNYITGSQALDYLKDLSGFSWNIDYEKRLNFFSRTTNHSPFELTGSLSHHGFRRKKTRVDYFNTLYTRGGLARTTNQVNKFKGDGTSQTFVTRFPVAELPKIFLNDVEIDSEEIGVNGLDTDKKFYFSYNSNVLSQDITETPLGESDELKVEYIGLYPLLTKSEETEEITKRGQIESGTSGIYERIVEERNINEREQAIQFADGKLIKYARIPSIVSFATTVKGLKAGQLLKVNKQLYGISDSFLIEKLNVYVDNKIVTYSAKCLDGSMLGGWEMYFKELLKGQRSFAIRENEVLERLVKFDDVIMIGDNMNVDFDGVKESELIDSSDDMSVVDAEPETRVGFALVGYSEVE